MKNDHFYLRMKRIGLFHLSKVGILLVIFLIMSQYSCKKFEKQTGPRQALKSGSEQLTISFQDIYEALPQTVMLTLKDSFKFYFDDAEWKYTDSSLIIRIPTSQTKQNYIYAIKKYSSPEELLLYSVGIIPDQGSGRDTFSGKEIWLDYQDWHVYGIQFEQNQPVQYLSPVEVAQPGWESCMMESGYFSLDENEHLVVHDEPLRGRGCPDSNPGPTFFERIKSIINDIIGWLSSDGGGDSGGGDGGIWGSGGGGGGYSGGGPVGVPGGFSGGGGSNLPLTEVPDLNSNPTGSDYPDNNGFYHSRKTELNVHLAWNENSLINCNLLDSLESIFPMWQDIASYQIPDPVRTRLYNLVGNYPNIDDDSRFEIQPLNFAAGILVNCDFFPIHINSLPYMNGVQMTPAELLEYFRKNINSFVETSIASFYPYHDYGINDSILWNKNQEQALGALVHIDMLNDGSIILGGYEIPPANYLSFTFSTLVTPLDDYHPVSGNRRFGIYPDPVNGGYVFYTSGVDRISTDGIAWGSTLISFLADYLPIKTGFETADDLWESVQTKMSVFCNANNGNATNYAPQNIKIRVPWQLTGSYLKKELAWFEFRQALGCL